MARQEGVSERTVCLLLGIARRTIQNWRRQGWDRRKGSSRAVKHRFTEEEREAVFAVACSMKYRDSTPAKIVALLAEEGIWVGSESTFYRVLRLRNALQHRRMSRKPRTPVEPVRMRVDGPNQVWSWDITWLRTDVVGKHFFAYTIIDLFDRSIVGWTIEDVESDELAQRLFANTIRFQKVVPKITHTDNGAPMRGMTLAAFLDMLMVRRSYSRPRVSDDNAHIEAWHKTLKYTVGFPKQFTSLPMAREWYAGFIAWYNTKHLHSALGYVTPHDMRYGRAQAIFTKRDQTMIAARLSHPERWRQNKTRSWSNAPVFFNFREHRTSV